MPDEGPEEGRSGPETPPTAEGPEDRAEPTGRRGGSGSTTGCRAATPVQEVEGVVLPGRTATVTLHARIAMQRGTDGEGNVSNPPPKMAPPLPERLHGSSAVG